MQESRVPVADGPLNVADTILNPQEYRVNGMDDVLRGLILEPEADADDNMVEGMRTVRSLAPRVCCRAQT